FLSGSSDPLTCHALFAEKEHPKQFPVLDALVSFNLPLGLVTNLMTLGCSREFFAFSEFF
ncbi:MAG: hypothetical protein IJF02_02225, partial [Oscillospiraceae bacterium]|nr:hypothetical protein [Oscillospiraceae bacterium]